MNARPVARAAWLLAALLATGLATATARAQGDATVVPSDSLPVALRSGGLAGPGRAETRYGDPGGVRLGVRVTPSSARIGEVLTYRGFVLAERSAKVRFEPPKSGGAFTWSHVRAGRVSPGWWRSVSGGRDSVWIEARLQIFETGPHAVEGPVVQLASLPRSSRPSSTRLPTVRIAVLPTVTAADSGGDLRGLHGPVAAPWWERIAWMPLVWVSLLLVAVLALFRHLRRRKPIPAIRPAAAPVSARPRLDPAAEALRALAALRARELPAAARFGEHALELTAILRRFLEATVTTPRPGDTSGELLERLKASRMPEDDFERLEGLLALWDRVKFARAPLSEAEAKRCEEAVEGYVRRTTQARFDAASRAAAASAAAAARPSAGPPPAPEAA